MWIVHIAKLWSHNPLEDTTGHDDLSLYDVSFILLNKLNKTFKEPDNALILTGSWNIVTRLSYVLLYWNDMIMHLQVKRIMVPV